MLTTHLKSVPLPKFILLEDTVDQRADDFLLYVIDLQEKLGQSSNIVYCQFGFNCKLNKSNKLSSVEKHNLVENLEDDELIATNFTKLFKIDTVIVIDSLADMVFALGKQKCYQLLHLAKKHIGIKQIITILHLDLFDEADEIHRQFENISSFYLILKPEFKSQNPRVSYVFKKSGGKVVSDTEQYHFENGVLVTSALEKLDAKVLVQESSVEPETLSTFKIGLNEKDKESRGKFTLPYLPKNESEETGGRVIYEFDDVDDWDEEDPDDDLDI